MKNYSINANGRLLSLDTPQVMGIINATPDSFYTDSRKNDPSSALKTAENMLINGAVILDIGGMSTRPYSTEIGPEEEELRLLPVIHAIHNEFPEAIISIDTYRSKIARLAVEAGASIINDISGGMLDKEMISTAAELKVPYICMHMKGTPQDMQDNPEYDNVVSEVFSNLQKKVETCRLAGIKDVIVDVGFGFGKTLEQSYDLLRNLDYFQHLDCPILAGISRKGMIYKALNTSPEEAITGTIAANTIAISKGAQILRVHDVKEAVECIKIWEVLNSK